MEWAVTPNTIKFQSSPSSKIEIFDVAAVKAFSTDRPVSYERHSVQYDNDDQSINGLNENILPSNVKQEIFLQLILKSEKSLYLYKEKNGREHFFIRENADTPIELLNRKYIRYKASTQKREIRWYEKWKQDLLTMSSTCKELKKQIETAKYNKAYLIKVFQDLNKCNGKAFSTNVPQTPMSKKRAQFGLLIQPFFGKYKYSGGESRKAQVQFAYGISYEVFSKSRPERVSFYNELKHRNFSQQIDIYGLGSATVSSSTIRMVNAVRMTYPYTHSSVFWNIGLLTGYRYKGTFAGIANFSGGGPEAGFAAGVGIKLEGRLKTSCQISYEWEQTPFDNYPLLVGHNFGLTLGMQF